MIQKWAHIFGVATIWFCVDININYEMVYPRARSIRSINWVKKKEANRTLITIVLRNWNTNLDRAQ